MLGVVVMHFIQPTRPIWSLALILAAILTACATTTSSTGRKQYVGGVSDQQLIALGTQAFAEAKHNTPLSKDSAKIAYVYCVVDALVAQLPPEQQRTSWETALFDEEEANAFALPGGKIGVNHGIFTVARNQDQLAAVIAHEIGHVIERHHDERITRQKRASSVVGVLSILGAAAGYGDLVSDGGGLLAQAGFLLPGTRAQESEADIVGQQLAARAGFDPDEAVTLWQNMIASGGQRPPQWLSTHPNPENRISELRSRALGLRPVFAQARAAGLRPQCG